MMLKIFIVVFLIAIIAALGSGLVFLVRDTGDTRRTVKALTWRISLSLLLIALLVIGYLTGIVQPHNLGQ
ncbi:twin transmembrane helix small protein [Endozoicomonas sp. G2_2]|nr:twin transmembrane helix small protein [Salinisphaera sp.]MBO9469734.1 twin transmembrane helix small protein [Endozoicomonas sp. G2_2]|tara:strand:+ start:693 stop:902 length:210 start_codon:yes stop_codon:yes gene_type:complete